MRSHRDYYKIVKSRRENGRVKKKTLKYLGRLSLEEFHYLKEELRLSNESDIKKVIQKFQQKFRNQDQVQSNVSLLSVRDNVYKKRINKTWLSNAYLKNKMTIGTIATLLGVSKDRVREHLDEIGIDAQRRLNDRNQRQSSQHPEFGWQIINGKKYKHPTEFEVIEKMFRWREEGLSYDKIAHKVTILGIKGRFGSQKWDRGTIRRILLRNKLKIER